MKRNLNECYTHQEKKEILEQIKRKIVVEKPGKESQQIKKRKLIDWICIQKEEEQLKSRVNLVHYNKL